MCTEYLRMSPLWSRHNSQINKMMQASLSIRNGRFAAATLFPGCTPRTSVAVRAGGRAFEVKLLPKGDERAGVQLTSDSTVVGSGASATLKVPAKGVAAEHAKLEKKNGRLFCTALVGGGDMAAETKTWVSAFDSL